jgi:hypothetical protein
MLSPLAALLAATLTASAGSHDHDRHHDRSDDDRPAVRVVSPQLSVPYSREGQVRPTNPSDAVDPEVALAQARAELAEIRGLMVGAHKSEIRRRIQWRLARVDRRLASAELELVQQRLTREARREAARRSATRQDGKRQRGPTAMNEPAFDRWLDNLEETRFSADRMARVQDAAERGWFTSAQIAEVLEVLPFGPEKVEAGALLYSRCVDPENWYVVYPVFDFRVDARALRDRVAAL